MLASSEQSGISEPQVGTSAAPQSLSHHQSLLDVCKAILQHRDLAGLFVNLPTRLRAIVLFDFLNLVSRLLSRMIAKRAGPVSAGP